MLPKVRIPLHGSKNKSDILDMHMSMASMNPKGFPALPTSRKNPRTHSKAPQSRIEALARAVYKK